MLKLRQVGGNNAFSYTTAIQTNLTDKMLTVSFEITSPCFHVSEKFSLTHYENWGLWDFDVIEIFLARSNTSPYLEIQLSPLNQKFALIIDEPRVKFHYPKDFDFIATSYMDEGRWVGEISINLIDIPGVGEKIWGNIHACLGEDREYYALFGHQDGVIDFHRPALFEEFK